MLNKWEEMVKEKGSAEKKVEFQKNLSEKIKQMKQISEI